MCLCRVVASATRQLRMDSPVSLLERRIEVGALSNGQGMLRVRIRSSVAYHAGASNSEGVATKVGEGSWPRMRTMRSMHRLRPARSSSRPPLMQRQHLRTKARITWRVSAEGVASKEHEATSTKQRARSNEQEARSNEQRAEHAVVVLGEAWCEPQARAVTTPGHEEWRARRGKLRAAAGCG